MQHDIVTGQVLKKVSQIIIISFGVIFFCLAPLIAQDEKPVVETIAEGLEYPWSMAFLPNGDMLVTERSGQLRIIRNGKLDPDPIDNGPETFVKSQGGYFDVILHPDFKDNNIIYISFAHGDAKANTTRIVKAVLKDRRLENVTPIFDTAPAKDTPVHYGGRMVFLPDGTLLITTGDGFDYREKAQKDNTTLGKIIRLDENGDSPENNPFTSQNHVVDAIWTKGHRSPQGLAIDPETSTVYMHEHGPRGGDEVNIVEAGANYGWPITTYGKDYSGATISPFKTYEGMVNPIKYWTPSIAPSGLTVYRGAVFPDWNGDLFVGGLVTRALHHLVIKDGKVVREHVLLRDLGERIRDVRTSPDGYIYLSTDSYQGKILRLLPK